jgi:hypothetical protein
MPRPSLISQIHELKYELRFGSLKSSEIARLQTEYDKLLGEGCREYRCSKAELLRSIAADYGKWVRDERLPQIKKDLQ